jgi:hypothetical protein
MTKRKDLYQQVKGRAAGLAITIAKPRWQGEDAFAAIMSDSEDPRQAQFLLMLPEHVRSEKQRQVLLDGLAREYGDAENWMAHVERECT